MKKALLIILILAIAMSMVLVACKSSDKPASGEWQGPAGEGQEEPQGEIVPQDNVQGPLTEADWIAALDCSTFPFRAEAICYKEDVEDVSLCKQIVCDYARNLCYEKSGEDEKIYAHIGGDYWLYTKESDPNALYPWVRSSNYSAVTGIFDYIPLVTLSRLFDRFRYQPSTGTYEGEDISISSSSDGMYTDASVITWRGDFSVLVEDGKLVRLVFKSYGQYYSSDNASRWEFSFSYDDVEITLPERFAETHRVTIAAAGTWYTISTSSFILDGNHPTFEIVDGYAIRIEGVGDKQFDVFHTAIALGYVPTWYLDDAPITGPVTVTHDTTLEVRFAEGVPREDNGAAHEVSEEEWRAAKDLRDRATKIEMDSIASGVITTRTILCDYLNGCALIRSATSQSVYVREGDNYWCYTTPLDANGQPDATAATRRSVTKATTFESIFDAAFNSLVYSEAAYDEESGNYYRKPLDNGYYFNNCLVRFDDGRVVEFGVDHGLGRLDYYRYSYEDVDVQVPQEYAVEYTVTITYSGTAGKQETMTFAVYSDHPTFGVENSDRLRITSEDRSMVLNNVIIALNRGYKLLGWYIDGAPVTFPVTIDRNVTLVAKLGPLSDYQDDYTVLPEQWAAEFKQHEDMPACSVDTFTPFEPGELSFSRRVITIFDGHGGAERITIERNAQGTDIKEEKGVSRSSSITYRSRQQFFAGDMDVSSLDASVMWRNNYPATYVRDDTTEHSGWRSMFAINLLNLKGSYLAATFDKDNHCYVLHDVCLYGSVPVETAYVSFYKGRLTSVEYTLASGAQGWTRFTYGEQTVTMPHESECRAFYNVYFAKSHGTVSFRLRTIMEGSTITVLPDDPSTLVWPLGQVSVTPEEGYKFVGWYVDGDPIESWVVTDACTITAGFVPVSYSAVYPGAIPYEPSVSAPAAVTRDQWESAFADGQSDLVEERWQWDYCDWEGDGELDLRYALYSKTKYDYEDGKMERILHAESPTYSRSYDYVATGDTVNFGSEVYYNSYFTGYGASTDALDREAYLQLFVMDYFGLKDRYADFVFDSGHYEGQVNFYDQYGGEIAAVVKVWFEEGLLRRIQFADQSGQVGILTYQHKDVAIVGYHEAVLYGALN